MANKLARIFIVMLLIMGLVGCNGCSSSFTKNAYSTLDTTRISVDALMQSAGDLYARGIIDDSDKDKIIEVHDAYREAHRVLCDLLETYVRITNEEEKEDLAIQIIEATAEVTRLASRVLLIVNGYLEGQNE
jgi:hypothetical protein